MLSNTDLLYEYSHQLNLLIDEVSSALAYKETNLDKDFLTIAQKRFGFDIKERWGFICTSMDVINGTIEAFNDFKLTGIDGITGKKFHNKLLGSRYLRLYGLLNSTYLHKNSLLHLATHFKIDNIKQYRDKFDNLEITSLRHKVGAHAVDCKIEDELHCFTIGEHDLTGFNLTIMNNKTNDIENYNLEVLLDELISESIQVLDILLEKLINKLHKTAKASRDMWMNRIERIRSGKPAFEEPEKVNFTITVG